MTDILHQEFGKLSNHEDSNDIKLIRVYFPDQSTTVLQINGNESCWDILCKICEKKSLKPGMCSLSTNNPEEVRSHHSDNSSNNSSGKSSNSTEHLILMNVEKPFFFYNCNTVYLIENSEEEEFRSRTSSRKSSTMITPGSRKTTIRLDSQSFPKTIEVVEPPEGDSFSLNSDKSKFDFSLKRGSRMFGFFLKGHRKNNSDSSTNICASPSQSANVSRQQSGINDIENDFNKNQNLNVTKNGPLDGDLLLKQISNNLDKRDILKRSLSDLGSCILEESNEEILSESKEDEKKIIMNHSNETVNKNPALSDDNKLPSISLNFSAEVDPLINNVKSLISNPPLLTIPSNTDNASKENEDSIGELQPTSTKPKGRRRACTVSISTAGRLVTSTLKSSKVTPRRPISGFFDGVVLESVSDIDKIAIKVTLPDKTVVNEKFVLECTIDDCFDSICERHKIESINHGIVLTQQPDYNVEYDRTLSYYKELNIPIHDISIIPQSTSKHYSTMTICENDIDVMVLQMSKEGLQVMAGTVPKLIEHLTDNSESNTDFLDTLLLTYRSFISPTELFNELVARFNCVPPENPTEEELLYYDKNLLPVQQRVIKTLRWWVHYHWQDYSFSFRLSENLKDFLKQLHEYSVENKTDVFKEDIDDITNIINTELKAYEEKWEHHKTLYKSKGKVLIDSVLHKFNEQDIAAQLCLHDFELFKGIHQIEYLNAIWKAKKSEDDDEEDNTPNLDFFISRFDKESYWAATEICCIPELKKRIQMLKKWILIANECIKRNNFFSFFSIVAGLNLTPVSRLKKTWDGLSEKYTKLWNELEKICDPSRNMKNYRDLLLKSTPPIVPFLPIYLKDLTFMNDGNEAKINGMINFDKLRMMAKRVKDISKLVNYSYTNINIDNTLQNYISHPMTKDLKDLKNLSLTIEPKETKK